MIVQERIKTRFSYLKDKFPKSEAEIIFKKMWDQVVSDGSFTLGPAVKEFEKNFAEMCGAKYAIGVANGTDALELSLWACGVRAGHEVICPSNTFIASLGCIGNLQATPVLVDIGEDYVMDVSKVEAAITPRTKAIIPVSFCGNPVDLDPLLELSKKHNIPIIGDNCQAFLAEYKGRKLGSIETCSAFSLHPLKILNCWADGGMITTNDDKLYEEICLHRNHGLYDRDTITRFPARNSRLDSLQAVVANHQLPSTPAGVKKRRENAAYMDGLLTGVVHTIKRNPERVSTFHLYFFEVDATIRDGLYNFLLESDIEAKIHYRTPVYLQPGVKEVLGHHRGDFPMADRSCDRIITIPIDECLTKEHFDYMAAKIKEYMIGRG